MNRIPCLWDYYRLTIYFAFGALGRDGVCLQVSTQILCEVKILLQGRKSLFTLHYAGPRIFREAQNLKSARGVSQVVEQKLAKEVTLGGWLVHLKLFLPHPSCFTSRHCP